MGGIAGILPMENVAFKGEQMVHQMLEMLSHRAPHGRVGFANEKCAIGFRCQDLAEEKRIFAGDESKKIWVMMDGEVFNSSFGPESAGYGNSDAERVLKAYGEKDEQKPYHADSFAKSAGRRGRPLDYCISFGATYNMLKYF